MEAAHSFPASHPTTVLTAQRGGLTPSTAKMNFYELQARFWQLYDEQAFTANETRLYFYLLNQFNTARWAAKIYRKTTQICADLSADKNTVNAARAALEARGLLFYRAGNPGASAVWSLSEEVKNSPVNGAERLEVEVKNSRQVPTIPAERLEVEVKNSPTYKEEEKIVVVEEEDKDTPLTPGKKMGAGVSEISSPALKAKSELVPPVARPPHDFAVAPVHSAEAKGLAAEIAALWYVTELRNQPRWARITGFVHRTEQAGQLAYLTAQFTAYRAERQTRGLNPHKLDDYLAGVWDECDWVAKAKAARPNGAPGPPPAPKQSKSNPTAARSWS